MSLKDEYNKIQTPSELSLFMQKYINYGYLDKDKKLHYYDDIDFNEKWFDNYVLESANDVLNTGVGNCFDQVELERDWFINNGYEVKTLYEMVRLDYTNPYPTHTFLIYKDGDNWNWIENADYDNRGIHSFTSLNELLNFNYVRYIELLKKYNIKDEEIDNIIVTEYAKPKDGLNALEFLNYVTNSKRINEKVC